MSTRLYNIKQIKKADVNSTYKFQLDNLDWATLIEENEEILVENEHGTIFGIDELSNEELQIVVYNLKN
jgi:formylmethanofuran dehydrogenase subunit B